MEILSVKEEDILFFSVKGVVNSHSSEQLQEKFSEWLDGGEKFFIGDLSELTYISSAGLRCLLFLAKKLMSGGGGLVIHSLQDPILDIMHLTGLDNVLVMAESKEMAWVMIRED